MTFMQRRINVVVDETYKRHVPDCVASTLMRRCRKVMRSLACFERITLRKEVILNRVDCSVE